MIATFVIGLREGLEAALIVSIIAAFLRQQGRSELLRQVMLGVGAAVAICVAGGITLRIVDEDLPQAQQEGLETIVGLLAVAMVTYMIIWMARHAKDLKHGIETSAASALASGSAKALVVMAFLAVLREGFETVVFLLAAFDASTSPTQAAGGALLGILVAVALGYGIYRGRGTTESSPLLPVHRGRTGAGRRRPAGDRRPHRPRSRLVVVRPGTHRESDLAGPSGHTVVEPAHRNAGHPGPPGPGRGSGLASLPGADPDVRVLAAEATRDQDHRRSRTGGQPMMTTPARTEGRPYRWRALAGAAAIAALALSGCSAQSTTATASSGSVTTDSSSASAAPTASAPASASAAASASSPAPASASAPASTSAPATTSGTDADAVSVVITDQGCTANHVTVPAGTVTFQISSIGSGAVTELELQRGSRILGERENIVPGLTGRFSITLDPGSYSLYCPGGSGPESQPFTVTPAAG